MMQRHALVLGAVSGIIVETRFKKVSCVYGGHESAHVLLHA